MCASRLWSADDDDDLEELEKRAMKFSRIKDFDKNNVMVRAIFYHELLYEDLKSHNILINKECAEHEDESMRTECDAWYTKDGEEMLGTAFVLTDKQRKFVNEKRKNNFSAYKPYTSKTFAVPTDAKFVLYLTSDQQVNQLENDMIEDMSGGIKSRRIKSRSRQTRRR